MRIVILTADNSFTLNGIEFEKGSLTVQHSDSGISINGKYGDVDEVEADGQVFTDIDSLKTWISSSLFKSSGGGGGGGSVAWNDITGKPTYIGAGSSQSLARAAIGAGTSNFTGVFGNLVNNTNPNAPIIQLTGTPSDTLKFDVDGYPVVGRLDITQLTDIDSFPPFANGVFVATAMNAVNKTGLLLFIEFSTTTPKVGTFPTYGTGGTLPVATGTQNGDAVNKAQLDAKANIANPTFTGTVGGISKSMVGLGSVDNTADSAKPVSTPQQSALDLKANIASPTFTGAPAATTAGLGVATTQIATTAFVDRAVKQVPINNQTASYTLILSDAGRFVQINNASANTLTVPTNASVAYPVNTQLLYRQSGVGQTTITAASGVTIQSASGLKTRTQYSGCTLIKVDTNTWALQGDLVV